MRKVSIIILTFNAPAYVKRTLKSLRYTDYDNYEVIVFDNHSDAKTRKYLKSMEGKGYFDKIIYSDENLMFIKGNNEAFKHIAHDSELVMFLNSDVEIRNREWLKAIVETHKTGLTGLDCQDKLSQRPDGWCIMLDTFLYDRFKLNEVKYRFYYSVADLNAKLINAGYAVQTIDHYSNLIWHFGNASGFPNLVQKFKKSNPDLQEDSTDGIVFKRKCELIDRLEVPANTGVSPSILLASYNFYQQTRRAVIFKSKRVLKKD